MAETASAPVLVCTDIHKRFGLGPSEQEVLKGVSLTVQEGELLALVGQSGSGKSTLLSVLGGLDRDYQGSIEVFSQDLARLSDAELSRLRNQRIGFVFQAFHLLAHLSCLENVLLPNAFSDSPLSKSAAIARAQEALSRVGLTGKDNARPSELSGGQRQRVAIARALFFRPKLLLCDEPTGNLDVQTGQHIIKLFSELNRDEKLTLLLVTHEPRVAEVASRILRMQDGVAVPAALSELALFSPRPQPAPLEQVEAVQ